MKKYLGLFLLVLGVSIVVGVIYLNSPQSHQTRTFSPYTLLTSSWENYKTRFINSDGRVIDYSQGGITTSEGQSYALLQAVWMDDKATFDKVWAWTKNNLKRPNDNLSGWRWGKTGENQYGLLPNGGDNAAADADTDIALALLLAAKRWENSSYLDQAKPIITDIWNIETDQIGNHRYVVAGNWAIGSDRDIINPSYFAPYAWRIFAVVDKDHDWKSLIDPAYQLLTAASHENLDKNKAVGLPPDWIAVSKPDGKLTVASISGLTTNYGFDAIRIPWRVTLDYAWNRDPQAKNYLDSLSYLASVYQNNGHLPSGFDHDGMPLNTSENPAVYATSLGYFMVTQPDLAHKIYQQKILRLYSNDTNSFRNDLPYYEESWLWFGSALYLNYLVPFGIL